MSIYSSKHQKPISFIPVLYKKIIYKNKKTFKKNNKKKTTLKIHYLKTSSLFAGSGKIVGRSGRSLSGVPSLPPSIIVAPTSDSTKKECQWV